MLTPVRIGRIQGGVPIVDSGGRASNAHVRTLNDSLAQIEAAINGVIDAQNAATAAQAAAATAQTAADTAQTAAVAAQTAADTAQSSTDAVSKETALQNSYIQPDSVLTATPSTISVAAHTRYYADGTTAAVNAGTVAATAAGDTDYVSYSDPSRAGGTVAFVASTTAPVQTGDIHVVGAVNVPMTGTASGGRGPAHPGTVQP